MYSRHELMESLLSSIANNIKDKVQYSQHTRLKRIQRKIVPSLPQTVNQKRRAKRQKFVCPFMFSPQSRFIIFWQVLNICLIYVYFIQIPITIAFDNHRSQNQQFFRILNFPVIAIFIVGVVVNLNTSFYQDGQLRNNPQQIRHHYIRNNLSFDIISIFSVLFYELIELINILEKQYLKFIILLFYLRIIQLLRIERIIINSFDLNRRIKAALKLFLLLIKIFLICNVIACSGFFISSYVADNYPLYYKNGTRCYDQCFLVYATKNIDIPLKNCIFTVQYIYSLYWASTTMISIGYGDITPKNSYQIGFTVFIQFCSCLLYGYSINQIWSIIQELNSKKYKIHSRLNIINLYMRDKGIGEQLISKVNAYLNNYYYAKNLRQRDIQSQIIGQLTPSLRQDLYYQSYSILFQHNFFNYIDEDIIYAVTQSAKEVCYYQNQQVQCKSQIPLLYLKKGQLLQYANKNIKINSKYNGDYLNFYQFMTQTNFLSKFNAIKYSLIYYLDYNIWRKYIYRHEESFQFFCFVRDKLKLYKQLQRVGLNCYLCLSNNHRTQQCFDHQLRDKIANVILKQRQQYYNDRLVYQRNKKNIFIQKSQRKRKASVSIKTENKFDLKNKTLNFKFYQEFISPKNRKSSVHSLHQRRGGRLLVKQKHGKQELLKHIFERVRNKYAHLSRIQQDSQQSQFLQQIKFQAIQIDEVKIYQQYYPQFNPHISLKTKNTDFAHRQYSRRFTQNFV